MKDETMRSIGRGGPRVCALGLGCMGMSEFYGDADEAESLATLHRAVELGVGMLDTADMYGSGHNEQLVGRFLREARGRVLLATKFGVVRDGDDGPDKPYRRRISGRPEYVRQACEKSLARLGVSEIDLYYYHRVDRDVPIEDTVGAMAALVREGKVRALGLSEVGAATLRRAHAVHPIAALQTEYSLARIKGCSAAQLALAWVLGQDGVVAIPGTKRRKYLEENMGALAVRLDTAELAHLAEVFDPAHVAGDRYPTEGMKLLDAE
jgi:aryl-alcohol dehydrogenase-like predicted oxidoreductase